MAKLPPLKRIFQRDIEEAPAWAKKLLIVINSFFQNTWQALDSQITLQDNIRCQLVDLAYIGGTPVSMTTRLASPLIGILVLQASGNGITGSVMPVWMQIEQRIEISTFTGLTSGNEYKLRLLFI